MAYLRPANIDPARHAWAILKLLVQRLRQVWPGVQITFRGDSGFCRWRRLRWCEDPGVDYVVSLVKNPRLLELAQALLGAAQAQFCQQQTKQRLLGDVSYAAQVGSVAAGAPASRAARLRSFWSKAVVRCSTRYCPMPSWSSIRSTPRWPLDSARLSPERRQDRSARRGPAAADFAPASRPAQSLARAVNHELVNSYGISAGRLPNARLGRS